MAKLSGKDKTLLRNLVDQTVHPPSLDQTPSDQVQINQRQTVGIATCFSLFSFSLLISGLLAPVAFAQVVGHRTGATQNQLPSLKQLLSESASPNLFASSASQSGNPTKEDEVPLALTAAATSAVSALVSGSVQANQLSNQPITPTIQFRLPSPEESLAQAPTAAEATAEFSPRVEARYNTQGAGSSEYFGFGGFVPVFQTPGKDLTYVQGRLLLHPNNTTLGGNLLVGYRFFKGQDNRVYGGYVAYDNRDTGRSFFNQIGVGLEALSDDFDARLNAYFPVGSTRNQITSIGGTSGISFSGNNLLLNSFSFRQFEAAATAVDLEVGRQFFQFGEATLRGYAGAYYLNAQGSPDVVGVRGRVEATASDLVRVSLAIQNDGLFDTRLVLGVGVNFPGSSAGSRGRITTVLDRMAEDPFRNSSITVADPTRRGQTESVSRSEVAINSRTGQPYRFLHVQSGGTGTGGTAESPFGTIGQALGAVATSGADVIYVRGSGTETFATLNFANGIDVLFNNIRQFTPDPVANANNQRLELPLFDPAARYAVNVNQLNLTGNDTIVSGITVNETVAITGNNNVLDNITVNSPTGAAVQATNVNGLTVQNSNLTAQNGRALELTNVTGNVNITGNTLNAGGAGNNAVALTNTSGTVNANISNNAVTANQDGIQVFLQGTAQGTATIANNTVTGGRQGITVEVNNTANAVFNILNNRVTNSGNQGILVTGRGNGRGTVNVTGNTVSGNTTTGAFVETQDTSQIQAVFQNNTITNNTLGGVFVRALGTSRLGVALRSNILTGNTGAGNDLFVDQAGVFGAISTGTVCVQPQGNTINRLTLNSSPAGLIQVEGALPGNNTIANPPSVTGVTTVASGFCGLP
ncbi:MAG: right-handed parallel beta-helix repeat-containing protein [Leptolyngbyaceae cyanobacterium bins.59]|nr:right-handed parallel beta-helix repeat-containing protein [Leptolyngbyaceae cyanobacterium bins.59]